MQLRLSRLIYYYKGHLDPTGIPFGQQGGGELRGELHC